MLAFGKHLVGTAFDDPVMLAEGKVTFVAGLLAAAVLVGLVLNVAFNGWWADPCAGVVITYYTVREARALLAQA